MKAAVKHIWFVLIFWGAMSLCQPCYAQDPAVESIGEFGTIDWINQKIVSIGIGSPPKKYIGTPQERPLALRAAITDARRNLLEVIKGVHIDSKTQVENYMIRDETVVSKVKGILNNAVVESYRYLYDGTVEATVSMPLTGQIGEILIRMATQPQDAYGETLPANELESRVYLLENRVRTLEDKLSHLGRVTFEQKEVKQLFKKDTKAWADYTDDRSFMIKAGYETDRKLVYLKKKLDQQEASLKVLSEKLEEMSKRPSSLEPSTGQALPKITSSKPKPIVMYSGLVIDARKTNFRPCLKPGIYSQGKLVYPGGYINMQKAVRTGLVWYYRSISRAQQSDRIGSLPYTVKALGTWKGRRSLEIDTTSYDTLKPFIDMQDSFMSACKVVIVF